MIGTAESTSRAAEIHRDPAHVELVEQIVGGEQRQARGTRQDRREHAPQRRAGALEAAHEHHRERRQRA